MGMFDMFEAALEQGISEKVDESVKVAFQSVDDRIVAIENGKVQSTFTGDVENSLTEDQTKKVARIVGDAVPGEVETAIMNGSAESAIESAVEQFMDYNLDLSDNIQNWMDHNFDPDSLVTEAIENSSEISELRESVSGIDSRVDDLEPIADSMDRLTDEFSIIREAVEGLDPANNNEVNERLSALESTVEDIQEAIRNFGREV